ncbi:hypothetical protein [Bacillus thermotolerans]|uniref:Uncharacterized protein n=1 Tax=Bacillus thermotolerans TaxID=1221996 RepID=A0A0F5HJK0_BACTR|nr:hypothetical protein [Bacillus thermotolerans]KKB33496.1 hypothetical protein QY97_03269 [Bacillus thermotolerans]KKB39696.1 hypothetical protein QY95_02116 [Bacillus thermotolerans]KKB40219.1 hypothetical protein QY96_02435 [Bacillus thermotolerans]
MLALLINEDEKREIYYLIKREMEEILLDLGDPRIDESVKRSMRKKYVRLLDLFKRVAKEDECMEYLAYHQNI